MIFDKLSIYEICKIDRAILENINDARFWDTTSVVSGTDYIIVMRGKYFSLYNMITDTWSKKTKIPKIFFKYTKF